MKHKDFEPLVSIVMVTYNHGKFIKEAIDGVVSQKTDFHFELLIGDDASSDETSSIILEYSYKYPQLIVPIIREKNIGATKNFMDLISKTRGKYVAICDGDDFWSDYNKLKKQVSFLEKNSKFTACCHPVNEIYEWDGTKTSILDPLKLSNAEAKTRGYLNIHDLIEINTVASLSVMFRWMIPRQLPYWMKNYIVGDYPVLLFHANKGDIGVLPEVMGTYRRHKEATWLKHNETLSARINFFSLLLRIDNQLNHKYWKELLLHKLRNAILK